MTEYGQLVVSTMGPPRELEAKDPLGRVSYFGTDHQLGGIVPYEGWQFESDPTRDFT